MNDFYLIVLFVWLYYLLIVIASKIDTYVWHINLPVKLQKKKIG